MVLQLPLQSQSKVKNSKVPLNNIPENFHTRKILKIVDLQYREALTVFQ
jgi:hypothetical protein